MHVKLEKITPFMARRWLAIPLPEGLSQRKISMPTVNALATAGKAGQLKLTGDTIKLGVGEYVLDGQHRLTMCVMFNISFESYVAYEVPDDVLDVLDDVRPRSPGDKARMAGTANASAAVAVANTLVAMIEIANGAAGTIASAKGRTKRTYLSLKPTLDEWGPEIQWSISAYPNKIDPGIASGGAPVRAALVYARMCGVTRPELDPFIREVVGGAEKNTPAWALRNAITRTLGNQDGRRTLAIQALKAIELALAGKPCGLLRDSIDVLGRMAPLPRLEVVRRNRAAE